MATLVKWWRTKFLASPTHHNCPYKAMSVLGSDTSDGRPSDTEDLVRDDTSYSDNGAHVNAGLATSDSSDSASQRSHNSSQPPLFSPGQVKFEDFECDVHVEGSESGEERKEFSFTFYDLDGHGKITRQDIAGLVRSIYGAVNDSITVPHGGKKTIKVRLTVTPEQQAASNAAAAAENNFNNNINLTDNNTTTTSMGNGNSNQGNSRTNTPAPPDQQQSPPRPKLRNNVNVTIQENLNRERRSEHRRNHHNLEKPKFSSVRIPNNSCRGCRNLSPDIFRDCSASPMRNRKKWRERNTCSLQLGHQSPPDLIELLQANMEKNNVSPCCRLDYNHPTRQSPTPSPQHHPCTHNHLIDPGCPILPLLNNDSVVCKDKLTDPSHLCSPPPPSKPTNGPGSKFFYHRNHLCKKHHIRSRSHDLSSQNLFKYHMLSEKDQLLITNPATPHHTQEQNNQNNYVNVSAANPNHHHEETLEVITGCIMNKTPLVNKNTNNLTQFGTTTQPTPHQLKHRNREQEHTRAIERVISWLERENLGGAEKKFSSPRKNINPPIPSTPPAVKKHEHHHIHEHIHHHYHHHYSKETPIIV